jgi:hypothetical protein
MSKKSASLLIFCLLLLASYAVDRLSQHRQLLSSAPQHSTITDTGGHPAQAVLGAQTKASGCMPRGTLPDPECTPGAVIPTVTVEQICASGYSSSVRNVSTATKTKVYKEYGITTHPTGSYEVDHLVSLELGGSNDIANLWPEAAEPAPGFHQKDVVENYLHDQVCKGKMPLADAQKQIAGNWLPIYQGLQ